MKFMKLAIKLHDSFAVHPGLWLHAEIVDPGRASASLIDEEESQLQQLLSRADEDVDQLIPVCKEAPAYG